MVLDTIRYETVLTLSFREYQKPSYVDEQEREDMLEKNMKKLLVLEIVNASRYCRHTV